MNHGMKNLFEIRKQFGLSRIGQISFANQTFKTPNLILPQHRGFDQFKIIPKRINTHSTNENESHFETKDFIGIKIEDGLRIANSFQSVFPNDQAYNKIFPVFYESKNLWGIPMLDNFSIESLPKIQQTSLEEIISKYIVILCDNYPNTHINRFTFYNSTILTLRLKIYEEIIFSRFPNSKFVIDVIWDGDTNGFQSLKEWVIRNKKNILGIRIRDLFQDLGNFSEVQRIFFDLKTNLPSHLLWIAGGQIYPQDYPMAIYLGFDLIDVRSQIIAGSEGQYITSHTRIWARNLRNVACACSACQELRFLLPGVKLEQVQSLIVQHNCFSAVQEYNTCFHHLNEGIFRTYLEETIHRNPSAAAFLRSCDKTYNSIFSSRFPLILANPVVCIGPESYSRPEIMNFILRIREHVTPAKEYPLVLLLPCSAGKPYSGSRSHVKFIHTIRKVMKHYYHSIHQVIITSPLGVVPRECESIFPAAHYDIPVTGDWDAFEIESTADNLVHWLLKYTSQKQPLKVLVHLEGGYRRACELAENKINEYFQTKSSTTRKIDFCYSDCEAAKVGVSSEEGLTQLEELLNAGLSFIESNSNKKNDMESENQKSKQRDLLTQITPDEIKIRAVFDYQFGKSTGNNIIKNGAVLNQGYNYQYDEILIFDGAGKFVIGNIMRNTGLIRLTPTGGKLVVESGNHLIHLKSDTFSGTTIFRPLIEKIDNKAHPGDDMLVVNQNGQYMGVGELIQSPIDALLADSGRICTLRKKFKPKDTQFDDRMDDKSDSVKEMLGDDF